MKLNELSTNNQIPIIITMENNNNNNINHNSIDNNNNNTNNTSNSNTYSLFFRLLLLSILCIQASIHNLSMRYSRGILNEKYLIISTVIMGEIIKFIISILIIFIKYQNYNLYNTILHINYIIKNSLLMCIPGILYLIQNNLNYIALENLSSSTFALITQLKLLTTAIFSVIILKKQLFNYQWRALILLFLGVVLVQYKPNNNNNNNDNSSKFGNTTGLLAALFVTIISGLAGVYTELKLKDNSNNKFNLWDRNIQLSFYGIIFGIISIGFNSNDKNYLIEYSFFNEYSIVTIIVVLLGSIGGLLVSGIISIMDNIIKGFSVSLSIILTTILSSLLFNDVDFTILFLTGAFIVLIAIFNYNDNYNQNQITITNQNHNQNQNTKSNPTDMDDIDIDLGIDSDRIGLLSKTPSY